MGFLDLLSSGAKAIDKKVQQTKGYQEEYSCYDDSDLVRIAKREGVSTKGVAAYSILKSRYGEEEAKRMIRK